MKIVKCLVGRKKVYAKLLKRNEYTVWVGFTGYIIKRHILKHHVDFQG